MAHNIIIPRDAQGMPIQDNIITYYNNRNTREELLNYVNNLIMLNNYIDININYHITSQIGNSKITCPICKVDSFREKYGVNTNYEMPELDSECPICMTHKVNRRLDCGHCLCQNCVLQLENRHLMVNTPQVLNNNVPSHIRCHTCSTTHHVSPPTCMIYGIDIKCSRCQSENVNMLLPCGHLTCTPCVSTSSESIQCECL